uniref:ENTH domain-containing protein n=1 Tax=Spongospora subterranea TaxID=70186 RepID=A0A0H5QR45_9EUKA|eukprot:CRZ04545.1 hypothetical protein [Spongospora subterranea]
MKQRRRRFEALSKFTDYVENPEIGADVRAKTLALLALLDDDAKRNEERIVAARTKANIMGISSQSMAKHDTNSRQRAPRQDDFGNAPLDATSTPSSRNGNNISVDMGSTKKGKRDKQKQDDPFDNEFRDDPFFENAEEPQKNKERKNVSSVDSDDNGVEKKLKKGKKKEKKLTEDMANWNLEDGDKPQSSEKSNKKSEKQHKEKALEKVDEKMDATGKVGKKERKKKKNEKDTKQQIDPPSGDEDEIGDFITAGQPKVAEIKGQAQPDAFDFMRGPPQVQQNNAFTDQALRGQQKPADTLDFFSSLNNQSMTPSNANQDEWFSDKNSRVQAPDSNQLASSSFDDMGLFESATSVTNKSTPIKISTQSVAKPSQPQDIWAALTNIDSLTKPEKDRQQQTTTAKPLGTGMGPKSYSADPNVFQQNPYANVSMGMGQQPMNNFYGNAFNGPQPNAQLGGMQYAQQTQQPMNFQGNMQQQIPNQQMPNGAFLFQQPQQNFSNSSGFGSQQQQPNPAIDFNAFVSR